MCIRDSVTIVSAYLLGMVTNSSLISGFAASMVTKLAGGEIPDVMMLALDKVPRYALNGMLLPLRCV